MEEVKNNMQQNDGPGVFDAPVPTEYFRVNNRNLRSEKVLAEGGFGFVYQVIDDSTGE